MNTEIRNVAIIAHVDHGKTTLVDGFLKQSKTFRENESYMDQDLIMDSNDQERERGITILAKNTAINYKSFKINIIDTPGHADFGGEVERTLNMAEGAILVIDAQEGPMPQTKFVLKKAFELGLKIIVVINKIDKPNADIPATINKTYDLFLELAHHDDHLDFPIYYAIGREGKSWNELPEDEDLPADLSPILDAVVGTIPAPEKNDEEPFQLLISALDYDNFIGKYAIGKVTRGTVKLGQSVVLIGENGVIENGKIEKIFQNNGLKKIEAAQAHSGDIVSIAGLSKATIGLTIADAAKPEALPTIQIEEPTLNISVYANTSPFAGREGKFVTARQLLDRIKKELETNVSMRLRIADDSSYILSGRGELHLSVFIEALRREGYELQVGKPEVITKEIEGQVCEPIEELTIDVPNEYVNTVIGEVSRRRGVLHSQSENPDNTSRLVFEIATRGTLGLRNVLLTASKGTSIMNSLFLRFDKMGAPIPKLRNGVLIAFEAGKAVTYGLNIAQQRGITFIPPQTEVYTGMIVGLNTREDDLEINICKEKKLTNVRASSSDIAAILTPPTLFSLEQCIDFLEDDELLEVTPKSLRLRKRILDSNLRNKSKKN
ncbi:MAG: translational GTPase TypA [Patescibacteria group bacterium]